MKKLLVIILGILIIGSCAKPLIFPDSDSPLPPQLKTSSAKLLWIGPAYRVAVAATIEDADGITKVQLKNGEWLIDTVYDASGHTSFVIKDTIDVLKDANPTKHTIELLVTNKNGGVVKGNVDVEDLSAQNQIPGYNPDVLPPAITVTKPTVTAVTKFYGLNSDPINVDIDATITDQNIASIEVRVWGEAADGQAVMQEQVITPTTPAEKQSYHVVRSFALPAGKPGEYQYIVRSTDASGNKSVKGNAITVGYMDRLYLSDAENDAEVTNQAYEHYGACRGIGTLLSMKPQGTNVFVVDYYYRNEASDNIRFIGFIGSDRPFPGNQSTVNYTLNGSNVVAMHATQTGKITPDLTQAGFKLPVNQKGYYRITVNMTARTISVTPFTPTKPVVDAIKYPGWTDASSWAYLAVTGPVVTGSNGGYLEVTTTPKLNKESNHPYLYTGTFKTSGGSNNISINAPWAFVSDNGYGKGWFRLTAARTNMRDDYNDLISKVGAIGASGNGANYGFSVSNYTNTTGTFKATYDIGLERLRIVRIGN
jgi:hypothetical protein